MAGSEKTLIAHTEGINAAISQQHWSSTDQGVAVWKGRILPPTPEPLHPRGLTATKLPELHPIHCNLYVSF